jgi:hypothetical protein
MAAAGAEPRWSSPERHVRIMDIHSHIGAGALAALLALGSAAPSTAAPVLSSTAIVRSAGGHAIVAVRSRGGVAAGILPGVASGASPYWGVGRTVYPPTYPAYADPYFWPPATVVVPPPIVFAPPPIVVAPPVYFTPPLYEGWADLPYPGAYWTVRPD